MNEKGNTNFEYNQHKLKKNSFWSLRNISILIGALCCIGLGIVLLLVSFNTTPVQGNALISSRLDKSSSARSLKTKSKNEPVSRSNTLDKPVAKPVATSPKNLTKTGSKPVSESNPISKPVSENNAISEPLSGPITETGSDTETEHSESDNKSVKNGKIIVFAADKLFILDENKNLKDWEILYNLRVSRPTYSFNGKLIAFLNFKEDKYSLFIMKEDGTDEKELTSNVNLAFSFAFSYDDESILYKDATDDSLQKINIKSGKKTKFDITFPIDPNLSYIPQILFESSPKFSSDGNFLLCIGLGPNFKRGINVIDAKSGVFLNTLVLLPKNSIYSYSISPDCNSVAYISGSEIHIIDISLKLEDKTKAKDIIIFSCENKNDRLNYLTWSPDGNSLLYKHYNSANDKTFLFALKLNIQNAKPVEVYSGNDCGDIISLSWQALQNEKFED